MDLRWQLLAPAIAGLAFQVLRRYRGGGVLVVLFFALQLALIWANHLANTGTLVAITVAGGLALGLLQLATQKALARRIGIAVFVVFCAYWFAIKYVPALAFYLPDAGSLAFAKRGLSTAAGALGNYKMVGISYLGFKVIHFAVDYSRGDIDPKRATVASVLAWLLFFPSIMAGPIQRFQDWDDQTQVQRDILQDFLVGAQRVTEGLFLKIVLADSVHGMSIAAVTPQEFALITPKEFVIASVWYSFYLYWDFAGYSSMAIGIGRWLGVRLPENFDWPFLARNLAEFWNRWHMSLSSWLRDYLYYPTAVALRRSDLYGRNDFVCDFVPPVVTFVICGLWHGATMGYLLFGALHGSALGVLAFAKAHRAWGAHPFNQWWVKNRGARFTATAMNFTFVTFAFIPFGVADEGLIAIFKRLAGTFLGS